MEARRFNGKNSSIHGWQLGNFFEFEPVNLPVDFRKVQDDFSSEGYFEFNLDSDLLNKLNFLSKNKSGSLYFFLLSALMVVFYKYTSQETIRIALPKRKKYTKNDVERLDFDDHFFSIKTYFDEELSFLEISNSINSNLLDALKFQELNNGVINNAKSKKNISEKIFITNVVFDFKDFSNLDFNELEDRETSFPWQYPKIDLRFEFTLRGGYLKGHIGFSKALFRIQTIQSMVDHFNNVLKEIINDPEKSIKDIKITSDEILEGILEKFNPFFKTDFPSLGIVEMFENQVNKSPDAIALEFEEEFITYLELDQKSNQLAHYIRRIGLGKGTLIPICLDKKLELVVGILGILKAGAAYVPIDSNYPIDRVRYVLEDIDAELILSDEETISLNHFPSNLKIIDLRNDWEFIKRESEQRLNIKPSPGDLAYIIYTSGSTGHPKGVMINHYALTTSTLSRISFYKGSIDDSLLVSSIAFDASVAVIFPNLVFGKKVVLCKNLDGLNPNKIKILISKVKDLDCSPSYYKFLMDEGLLTNSSLNRVIVGGESLDKKLVSQHFEINPNTRLFNEYGPTEGTVWATVAEIFPDTDQVTIGKPIENTRVYILGNDGSLMPEGLAGELCITGSGISCGYLNKPELTSEKFIDDYIDQTNSLKIYKTGDLARWLPDGNIEYLGRIDDQVKIRGFRIELGEIQAGINSLDGVRESVVVFKEYQPGEKHLIAYIVAESGLLVLPEVRRLKKLKHALKGILPEYMLPNFWVFMDKFPLNSNGKIDKRSLPEPDFGSLKQENIVEPETENEKLLASIWCRVLGLPKVGIKNDFFELGGHSLTAMRLISMIKKEMQLELQISDIFSYPTINKLSKILSDGKPVDSELSEFRTNDKVPLSFNQESLWILDKLNSSLNYHIPLVFKISGKLNEEILERTFLEIISRHEVLKTGLFELQGSPVQRTIDPFSWRLEIAYNENFTSDRAASPLFEKISDFIYKPFNLENDTKIRASLIKSGKNEHILVIVLHHIASDGWSLSILKNELSTIYDALIKGDQLKLSLPKLQYGQFSLWQRQTITQEWLELEFPFWRDKLCGVEPLQLPTDFQRPPVQSTSGGMVSFSIVPGLVKELNSLSKKQGVTLFMTLLSAFKVFLYKYSSQNDVCVGIPVAGRELPELEELIGLFVNSVPVRTHFNPKMSFLELLDLVKLNTLEIFEHRTVPFEKIVDALNIERDLSRNPIFQTMFTLQNIPDSKLSFAGNDIIEISHLHKTSVMDLTFELFYKNGGIEGRIEYSSDLFTQRTAEKMAIHYLEILNNILLDPLIPISRINMLNRGDFEQVFNCFNPFFNSELPSMGILEMFENQVKRSPEAIAVKLDDKVISYADLDKKSNQLAHYLRRMEIERGSKVPICMDRSFEMIVGIMGILKAGAAYVPIDPNYPLERIRFVLEDLNAVIILMDSALKDDFKLLANIIKIDIERSWDLIGKESVEPLGEYPSPGDLAYVIYTSGTTGQPKGVLIEHGGLSSSTASRLSYYSKMEATLLASSFAFDSSVAIIFGTLVSGGKLILCRSGEIMDPFHLNEILKETEELLCVPSYYKFLLDENLLDNSILKRVVLGGENLDQKLVRKHFEAKPGVRLFNEYGPTEGTVWATVAEIFPVTECITIGKPIENTKAYIISSDGFLQPVGIPGELCITGRGISRGYLNRPELNGRKFVSDFIDETNPSKVYRTGDLARWLPDGNIEYLGRQDEQVKIRGYRIELGEIQSSINSLDEVDESVVILREDEPGDKLLVAYVVVGEDLKRISEIKKRSHLKEALKKTLPEYMVPNEWVFLEKLPLTANSKIDKKNLPKPLKPKLGMILPYSDSERLVASIWSVCLKRDRIDALSDFFELGGNSLLAVRMITMLEKETGKRYPLNIVFKYPVLSELAKFMDSSANTELEESLVPIKSSGTKPPIYLVHGVGSSVSIFYNLARFIDEAQPVYGFQPLGINGKDTPHSSIEEMAEYYVSLMLRHNPDGPYLIGGFSFGGYVAFEMGKQLLTMGKKASKIMVFDTPVEHIIDGLPFGQKIVLKLKEKATTFGFALKEPAAYFKMFKNSLERRRNKITKKLRGDSYNNRNIDLKETIKLLSENNHKILDSYRVVPCPIEIYLFKAKNRYFYVENEEDFGWGPFVHRVHKVPVSGHHEILFSEPRHIQMMARKIEDVINNQ